MANLNLPNSGIQCSSNIIRKGIPLLATIIRDRMKPITGGVNSWHA